MKKNVAVLYGGFSSEAVISIKSGKYVASILDEKLFDVFEILIDKDKWTEVKSNSIVDRHDFSVIIDNKKITFDAVVIEIHGNPGENGILQSYFDLLQIPYNTTNALVSALTFNKYFCNNYLKSFGVLSANSVVVRKNENYDQKLANFIDQNSFPFFIKPNEGGSSFGTTKIFNEQQTYKAITEAFEHSNEVILEQFIKGIELTCGVIKNNFVKALTPMEIRSKHEFFDYESKYNSELNEEIIPAPVAHNIIEECKYISEKIYEYLNCNGIVRMDYILKENMLYFLEVNTVPGMTSESIVPKMLVYDKINITDLFSDIILTSIQQKH
ncbi:MAG: D-alanine--D-alanine ligase [Bacteroidales bacterium]|nr:D-alanine--D-alanine ligase [Bacteroidales bacterium]